MFFKLKTGKPNKVLISVFYVLIFSCISSMVGTQVVLLTQKHQTPTTYVTSYIKTKNHKPGTL
jgi:hypothetical protein